MSSPERPIRLSLKARQDFIDILRYTGERWGESQMEIYRGKLDAALRLIACNPAAGHRDDRLPELYRLFLVGSHVVVYRDDSRAIGIARILHQRMHLPQHVLAN